jgi:phosphoribosylaminoimidazolecarboxamide formyltransferase/IMP cyclohydrolase
VQAIIQPGGSINDKKVIEAANNADLVMAFTGIRHFKH